MQEDNRNGEHHLRHAEAVADKKTNCYNKNQEAAVSLIHQRMRKL